MSQLHFRAFPLTPIHIGDGSLWTPEDFLLAEDALLRFDPVRVLADMAASARLRFVEAANGGRLEAAQAELRRAVDQARHVAERIGIGPTSRAELRAAFEPASNQRGPRRGEVHPFIRSAGRPYLPGSSIKGAIRTAVVSALVEARQKEIKDLIKDEQGRRRVQALEKAALGGAMEKDPLRFLRVPDVALPRDRTRIDRVVNWRPRGREGSDQTGGRGAEGMQMHYERLLSVADVGWQGAAMREVSFEMTFALDADALARTQAVNQDKAPRHPLETRQILTAVNTFYLRRFQAERERFYATEQQTEKFLQPVQQIFSQGGAAAASMPGGARLLLRLGRFCQFESLSVEGLRQGWNPQARRPMQEGTTRNVIRLTDREPEMILPFGWLLLLQITDPSS